MKIKKVTLSDVEGKYNHYLISIEVPDPEFSPFDRTHYESIVSPFEFDGHFLIWNYPAHTKNPTLKSMVDCIFMPNDLLGIAHQDNLAEKTYQLALEQANKLPSDPSYPRLNHEMFRKGITWVLNNQTAKGRRK